MFNTYASCESGAEIAFECTERNWHIHADFFHLEAVDENMELVGPDERGRLVITKLWGSGTPVIRYTGMEDWITVGNGEKCSCGLKSPIFGKPVEGRVNSNIVLPDGRVFPPSAFLFISDVLHELKTFKVKRFQIVQNKVDEIDILLVIDEDLIDREPSFNEIARKIQKIYQGKTGPDVAIAVREVGEIKDDPNTGKPAPIVVSYVNAKGACKIFYR
jgi:phenylacetate-coenzyme A ligase PaaK-like adenylate-forming protein